MSPFWVEFTNRAPACIEVTGDLQAAKQAASAFGEVKKVHYLRYPREPRIGERSGCPSFCFGPVELCLGRTSCPRRHACDD